MATRVGSVPIYDRSGTSARPRPGRSPDKRAAVIRDVPDLVLSTCARYTEATAWMLLEYSIPPSLSASLLDAPATPSARQGKKSPATPPHSLPHTAERLGRKEYRKKKVLSGLESSDLVSAAAAARRGLRRLACAPPGSPHPSPLPRLSVPWDASASGPRAPASEVFPLSIPKRARASCVRVGTQHRACSTLPIWQHSTPLAPATAPAPASTGAVWCFQKQGEVCKRLSFLSVFSVGEGGWVWRGWAEEAWRVAGCFTREHHTHTRAHISEALLLLFTTYSIIHPCSHGLLLTSGKERTRFHRVLHGRVTRVVYVGIPPGQTPTRYMAPALSEIDHS
ncbi:hypothetical protein M432DRAFT_299141 [Thermoascus aurantiacus ATCC 26904]